MADLRTRRDRLRATVEALESRRAALEAAIAAVRDRATTDVRAVGEAATAATRRAAQEFERLVRQAEELRVEVALAHALRRPEAAVWAEVRPEAWVGLLDALLRWAQLGAVAGTEVPLPDGLRGPVKGSLDYPALHGPLRLPVGTLVRWLALAVGVHARAAGSTPALPAATTGRRQRGPAAGARRPAAHSRSRCPGHHAGAGARAAKTPRRWCR